MRQTPRCRSPAPDRPRSRRLRRWRQRWRLGIDTALAGLDRKVPQGGEGRSVEGQVEPRRSRRQNARQGPDHRLHLRPRPGRRRSRRVARRKRRAKRRAANAKSKPSTAAAPSSRSRITRAKKTSSSPRAASNSRARRGELVTPVRPCSERPRIVAELLSFVARTDHPGQPGLDRRRGRAVRRRRGSPRCRASPSGGRASPCGSRGARGDDRDRRSRRRALADGRRHPVVQRVVGEEEVDRVALPRSRTCRPRRAHRSRSTPSGASAPTPASVGAGRRR